MRALGTWSIRWVAATRPWSNVYGVGRSLVAAAHLLTFVFCDATTLFHPVAGTIDGAHGDGVTRLGLFFLLRDHLDLARVLAVALLGLVVSGWRPRLTGVLHAYVAWSFAQNATLIEGGEQIAQNLAILLLPVTLTDPRTWHWDPHPVDRPGRGFFVQKLIANLALVCVRLQVAGVYFDAATGKMAVPEWADGTALYYFFQSHTFGPSGWIRPVALWIADSGPALVTLTWSVLVIEAALAAGLLAAKRWWWLLLGAGVALHAGIIVIHGLVSFGLIMMGALVLYLRPKDRPFLPVLPFLPPRRRQAASAQAQ